VSPTPSFLDLPDDVRAQGLYAPLGLASPLWLFFAGATSAGLAYWWMTRWPMMATNLEATMAPVETPALSLPVLEPVAEPQFEAQAAPDAPVAELVPAATLVTPEPVVEPTPAPKAVKAKAPPADDPPLTH